MKKYIFILFAACLFASCNDGLLFDDYLNELGYEFEETNLSASAVLTSGDYWEDNYLENVYSTKPNGKGKVYKPKDHLMPVGGSMKTMISVTSDKIRFYYEDSTGIVFAPYDHFYSDSPIVHIDNNEIVFESGGVWKIVRYDEKKIVLDIHMPDFQFGGDHYPYGRIILHKKTLYDGSLDDKYVSYEEYKEAYRQVRQKYWESKTVEYLEDYVADELASGRSTLEQLHRYFQYYCPELYESTIKYILEKYK